MENKWPKANMDFYKKATDPFDEITIHNSGVLENDFYRYASNFYEAALVLMNKLIGSESKNTNIGQLDMWYYALIYLYRQSLELLLKSNIFKLVPNEQDRKDIVKLVRHDLKQAFDKIIEITGLDINTNKNTIWLSKFLEDISRIDRESDMFRYPFGNDLRVLFEEQTHISLVATYYNMGRAFDLLNDFYKTNQFKKDTYQEYEPKLIVEGGEYYEQSVVGYKYHRMAFHPYNRSYDECATYLAEKIKEECKDHLFMPMCYLYRNSIELGLKKIIVEDSKYDSAKKLRILKRKKHSIQALYNSISDELHEHDTNPNDDTLTNVEHYISTFHNIDTTSDLFRYPCNNNLDVHFATPTELDIDNVINCFQELINFLDCVSAMLSQIRDYEAEMEAEYRSCYS